MGKKFIMMAGKKVYLKDAEPANTDEEVKIEEEEDEVADASADAIEKSASKVAKDIVASLGLDQMSDLKAKVDTLLKRGEMVDSKLSNILHGKSLNDKSALTKEEKICGFFHALVSKNEVALKALSEGTAADGGYLFPDEFQAELVREIAELNVMRGLVRVVPMRRDVMNIPTMTSSVQVAWTAENAAKSTTTARFYQATLTVKKMASIIYLSDELVEDSTEIDIVQTIITLFAEAMANEEERVIAVGNGTTQPTGIETARAAGTIASVAASSQNFDDVIALEYALPAKYSSNAVFVANRELIKELRKLKDDDKRYLWQPSPAAGQPATLNGKPLYECNHFPSSTLYFGDFKRGYWLGDRKAMAVKITNDSETAFTKDQTAVRVVQRIAGNVVFGNAIKALTGM